MLLAAAPFFAEHAGTVDISNRTEVRVRQTAAVSAPPGTGGVAQPAITSFDFLETPSIKLGLKNHTWESSAGYSAALAIPDLQLGFTPQLLHFGDLGVGWHNRRVRVDLTEAATYGETNSAVLLTSPTTAPGATTPPPANGPTPVTPAGSQLLAQPATLRFGSSRTTLFAQYQLSRHWAATSLAEYSLQGGIDATSRAILPLVRLPRGEASVSVQTSRVDDFVTRATVQHADSPSSPCSPVITALTTGTVTAANFNCAPVSDTAQLTESWRHRLTRTSFFTLGGGASYVRVHLRASSLANGAPPADGDPQVQTVYPFASVSYQIEEAILSRRVRILLEGQTAPIVDLRTGLVDERGIGTLTVVVPVHELTVTGSGSGARSIDPPLTAPITVLQAGVEGDYKLGELANVGAGVRYIWQDQGVLGTFSGGFAFVRFTIRAPQLTF